MRVPPNRDHSTATVAFACPLCGRAVAPEIRPIINRVDLPVARRLQSENPGWSAESGACPECVQQAARNVRQERSQASIHEELMLPYPVYAWDDLRLLPTPQRAAVNPQYTGQGVTLAFLDSGFYPHPDLTRPRNRILCTVDASLEEILENANFGTPHFTSWHGLMTSCVAAGNGYKSGRAFRGIAYRSDLVLVKTGNPTGRGIHEADIQRALAWVLANQRRFDVRVVNISLGGDRPSNGKLSALDRLVEEATARGLVIVTAAGNSGAEGLVPPASAPSAITVGGFDDANSYDRSLWRMYHSSYGRGANWRPKPEVIAPAMWLAAPMLPRTRVHKEGMLLWQIDRLVERLNRLLEKEAAQPLLRENGLRQELKRLRQNVRKRMNEQKYIHPHYQHVDGTSMAAPIVTSIVAQMIEANPALTPAQVKSILINTATHLAGAPLERQGAGVVNAARAVAAARRAASNLLKGLPFSPYVQRDKISFYYFDPQDQAANVALIGSFNHWNPDGFSMHAVSPGLWSISIPALPPGSYWYKFIVDAAWMEDPENPNRVEDGFGGFSSILHV